MGRSRQQSRLEEEKSRLLEQLYVHDVYDRIAQEFENSQHKPWDKVTEFLKELEPGSLVADIGCGNAHYINVNPNITIIGVDRCQNILELAQNQHGGLVTRADCLALPYKDERFDAVICIGLLHHLVSSKRQVQALKELSRIVKPKGKVLICAMAWEQPSRKFAGQNVLVPRLRKNQQTLEKICGFCGHNQQTATKDDNHSIKSKNFLFSILTSPSSILKKITSPASTGNSTKSHYTSPTQQSICCVALELPEGFQVREFPASSLFQASSNKSDQMKLEPQIEHDTSRNQLLTSTCQSSTISQSRDDRLTFTLQSSTISQSRDDRFYHVFKNGEIDALVKHNVSDLTPHQSVYEEGNWCVVLTKSTANHQITSNSTLHPAIESPRVLPTMPRVIESPANKTNAYVEDICTKIDLHEITA